MKAFVGDTDSATRHVERYSRAHRGTGPREKTWIEQTVERVEIARSLGIEEELAVGLAIILAERNDVDSIKPALIINRVAAFLRRQFAPPIVFRLLGRIFGNPIQPGRTKKEYVRDLTATIHAWPDLARAAID